MYSQEYNSCTTAADTADPTAGDEPVRDVCCVSPGDGLRSDPVGVSRKTAQRILCDAVIQGFKTGNRHDRRLSERQRVVNRTLKRAVRLRDGGCTFLGCCNQGWVDAHHILAWTKGGLTREENLVCLCRAHHRLVHEGGWNISGSHVDGWFFHRPDGTIISGSPALRIGDRNEVERHGRTDKDARCRWDGDRLDLSFALDVIIGNAQVVERAKQKC